MPSDDAPSFRAMFDRCSGPVFAYARRHSDAVVAEDIAAETFLIAWRRRDELPADPLPWLIVVARNLLANKRRSLARDRDRFEQLALLHDVASFATAGVDHHLIERETVLAALTHLTAVEREAIFLVAWDGLSMRAAAQVADCSEHAFSVRLHRARKQLERGLEAAPSAHAVTGLCDVTEESR